MDKEFNTIPASEDILRTMIDKIPTLAWSCGPDGTTEFLNQRWLDYTGLSMEEALGWGGKAVIHAEDLENLMATWLGLLASGEPGQEEARLRRFDGEYRWFGFLTRPLVDASGQIIKWCGINTDIENLRPSEAARRAQDEHYWSLMEGIPALVTLMTPHGAVDIANSQVLEYFGETLEQIKGWVDSDIIHPDDLPTVLARWRRALDTGEPYDVKVRMRRADGIYRWFQASGLPLGDVQGRVMRWCILETDIDDRKRAEAMLAGATQLLKMVAGSHSMPEILNAICQFIESTVSQCYCSVVLVDTTGTRLEHGAAPNLPVSFIDSIVWRGRRPRYGPLRDGGLPRRTGLCCGPFIGDTMGGARMVPNGHGVWTERVLVDADFENGRQGIGRVRNLFQANSNANSAGTRPYRPIHAHCSNCHRPCAR